MLKCVLCMCVCFRPLAVQTEAGLVIPLTGQTIVLSNSCFTRFKRSTVAGIRADQAAAQRTTRLTVTSKHRGLSSNCLVKMITANERQRSSGCPPHSQALQCCREPAPCIRHRLNKDVLCVVINRAGHLHTSTPAIWEGCCVWSCAGFQRITSQRHTMPAWQDSRSISRQMSFQTCCLTDFAVTQM